jgi:uracil-DNA glycosylase
MNRGSEASEFLSHVQNLKFANAFNPYTDFCQVHDLPNAPVTRSTNLVQFLQYAVNSKCKSLWIGRDLGHRGGRRTGLPLTDDFQLDRYAALYGVANIARATRGAPVREATATAVWQAIAGLDEPIFLWNAFPLHPHSARNQFSNRSHTRLERAAGIVILQRLVELLSPTRVLTLGGEATAALERANLQCKGVRHPSYGGQRIFRAAIRKIYRA